MAWIQLCGFSWRHVEESVVEKAWIVDPSSMPRSRRVLLLPAGVIATVKVESALWDLFRDACKQNVCQVSSV